MADPSFRLLGIHHVSVVVASTVLSLTFYRDLLGLRVDPTRPEMPFEGAWLDLGRGQQLHLLEVTNPDSVRGRPVHGGRDRHLALAVENLSALEAELVEQGISFTKSASGRAALFCRDPDGNGVELLELPVK